jgi:hypothetical protein
MRVFRIDAEVEDAVLRRGGLVLRVLGSLAVLGIIAALFVLLVPKSPQLLESQGQLSLPQDEITRECEEELKVLLESISPGRLGISSDRIQAVNRLNAWRSECGDLVGPEEVAGEQDELRELLTAETLTRTLSERFLPEDVSHVRNALLCRDIVARLTDAQPNSIDRYFLLLQFVVRNEMLVPPDLRKELPLTPYEALQFGLGTDEDRAWTLAEMLRQLRTDLVLVRPRDEQVQAHWLMGIVDAKLGTLLYDPRLGLPIPSSAQPAGADAKSAQPATLQEVRGSDQPFRSLDLPDSPYPLTSRHMQDVEILVVGTSSSWAPRMARLQFLLPPQFSSEIFDGLGVNALRALGLRQRIIDAGQQQGDWKPEDVKIWTFPEEQVLAFEATRGQGAPNSPLANFTTVFQGPYLPQKGADGQVVMVPVEKSLHFVRVEQLKGNLTAAIRDYLPIRSTAKRAASKSNELAAEYAALWTGVAQYDVRKYSAAFNTLGRFVSGQATSGGLMRAGMEWGAECLVAEKQYAQAIELLKQAPAGLAPRRDALLIRQWAAAGGISLEQKPAAQEKPLTSPAASGPQPPVSPEGPEPAWVPPAPPTPVQ